LLQSTVSVRLNMVETNNGLTQDEPYVIVSAHPRTPWLPWICS